MAHGRTLFAIGDPPSKPPREFVSRMSLCLVVVIDFVVHFPTGKGRAFQAEPICDRLHLELTAACASEPVKLLSQEVW